MTKNGEPVSGRLADTRLYFFSPGPGRYLALAGLDLEFKEEKAALLVEVKLPSGIFQEIKREILVKAKDYGVQKLTLPSAAVDLDEETLARAREEARRMEEVLSRPSSERFWQAGFIVPVKGRVSGPFGYRRILNDQERARHAGVDLAAAVGTPVKASNAGQVVLVADLFFSGKSVVVDHGLGLFTMYFHLNSTAVKEGQRVKQGHLLGSVGKTGRASGPNLHWGVRLNGARLDPLALTNLEISR